MTGRPWALWGLGLVGVAIVVLLGVIAYALLTDDCPTECPDGQVTGPIDTPTATPTPTPTPEPTPEWTLEEDIFLGKLVDAYARVEDASLPFLEAYLALTQCEDVFDCGEQLDEFGRTVREALPTHVEAVEEVEALDPPTQFSSLYKDAFLKHLRGRVDAIQMLADGYDELDLDKILEGWLKLGDAQGEWLEFGASHLLPLMDQ